MKLQKFMSQTGVCSRRKAEEYIEKGLVSVNGQTAHIGQVIDPDVDKVIYGDQLLTDVKEYVYYKLHKPYGVVTTCADLEKDMNILDIVNIKERVFPIGRLDKNSTGLILLTNDGRITHRLLHPSFIHEKEYIVEVFGKISDAQIARMEKGLWIRDGKTKPCKVHRLSTGRLKVILTEGKNRQIRRMVEKVEGKVKRLKRVRIENIHLGDLQEGQYVPLSLTEKNTLLSTLDLWES